ncbi:hypothetical protein RRG08_025144 [Elysia crispata]|uniref:Uncharacterized protein n=1 Tax=Elysia crispata TaxID=231223 RepID=A0AAE1CVK2_9GAST|nr:hypothetical protein RRG08_025144 [Elysia crispata]
MTLQEAAEYHIDYCTTELCNQRYRFFRQATYSIFCPLICVGERKFGKEEEAESTQASFMDRLNITTSWVDNPGVLGWTRDPFVRCLVQQISDLGGQRCVTQRWPVFTTEVNHLLPTDEFYYRTRIDQFVKKQGLPKYTLA